MTITCPDRCPTCDGVYRKGAMTVCSNAFHCCRDCVWRAGKVVDRCLDHAYTHIELEPCMGVSGSFAGYVIYAVMTGGGAWHQVGFGAGSHRPVASAAARRFARQRYPGLPIRVIRRRNGDIASSESPCCHTNAVWSANAYHCALCDKAMRGDFT